MNKNRLTGRWVILFLLIALLCLIVSELLSAFGGSQTLREEELIEKKLQEMILSLDGISDASVMITLDGSERNKNTVTVRGVSVILKGKKSEALKVKTALLCATALGLTSDKIFVSFA